ncbi:MAG: Protein of unknown function DUF1592/DUF1588/DUF1587/ DUF1585/DUF1595/Planctomycete cytochrome C [Verrucomicrobia bacterium]|nr:MAG: Protein of unknown function DUF1592/DUF1588/DUF1587/ DUF1585/DUF1595/Planctomycete cytochrome C [Verrucomicrobiota bacterium]
MQPPLIRNLCQFTVCGVFLLAGELLRAVPARASLPPQLVEYCFDCHGEGSKKGGVALDQGALDPDAERNMWFSVWRNLDAELMPPSDKPRPSKEERSKLRDWVVRSALRLDPAHPDPGKGTIRRLNREEYRNTIKDLTGVDYLVEDHFPADDTGYGFDTIGAVLNLSPIHLEKYLKSAETIVELTFKAGNPVGAMLVPEGPPPPAAEARRDYLRALIRSFADRAFRRPVDEQTLDKLTALGVAEDTFEEGIKTAFSAVLAAPRFVFRAEIQPAGAKNGSSVPIDEYALASRMSYFLWSSTPDATLLELAASRKLRAQVPEQVQRMLQDPKGGRFVRNFVGQWLQSRDAALVPIQPRVILGVHKGDEAEKVFNYKLREAMRLETEGFFQYILRQNLPAEELLSAKYTFLNQPLAAYYGIRGVKGQEMRKVELPEDAHRQGLLSHGSFLVVTSNPTRTSPVKRGQFVLENLLGTPAPPPPPNIPALESVKHTAKMNMRQLMELHRSDALCASCHKRMDPLGLALESFNAMGMHRDVINDSPVDESGELITGEKFNSLAELVGILSTERKHDFYRCLVEKILTYALGRGMEASDIPTISNLLDRMDYNQGRLADLVREVVQSVPFQNMRSEQTGVARK